MTETQLPWRQPAAPAPVPYAGPAGAGQLGAALQPPPPPPPPVLPDAPHAGEAPLAPGEIGYHTYVHPADKPGRTRTQAIMITHADDTHVHGFVLGELSSLASFVSGQLSRSAGDGAPA